MIYCACTLLILCKYIKFFVHKNNKKIFYLEMVFDAKSSVCLQQDTEAPAHFVSGLLFFKQAMFKRLFSVLLIALLYRAAFRLFPASRKPGPDRPWKQCRRGVSHGSQPAGGGL